MMILSKGTILPLWHRPCRWLAALLLVLSGSGVAVAYTDHRGVNTDSLETALMHHRYKNNKELMGIYLKLIRGYLNNNSPQCRKYCELALGLSYELNALNARESAIYNLGLEAYGSDDFDRAVGYFEWALALTDSMRGDHRYSESDIDDNLSQIYGALGNVYNMQDRLHLAIEYYQRALPLFERYGWLQSQCILYHNVGELYLSMGNREQAKQNYLQAVGKGLESDDSLMMALPRKGLVKIYIDENDYPRAHENAELAYAYYHAHRDEEPEDYPQVLAELSRICLMQGHQDLKQARQWADEALTWVSDEMGTETRCDIYAACCQVAMAEGQWKQALTYGLQSVRSDSIATYSDASCYLMLLKIYNHLGQKEKAEECADRLYNIMQDYATDHYQSGLSQMEVLYQTEKKQAAIEQLTRQKQWLTTGIILTALILLLTALIFYLLWRSVRLSKQHELIKARHDLVKARLDGEMAERVRIARDLHDRMGGLLTALRQSLQSPIDTEADDNRLYTTPVNLQALSLVDDAIREMRNVAHHLLPDSLSRYGLRTSLRDFCATLDNVSFSYLGKNGPVPHQEALYCIVHELVNNAVKNAHARHINVSLITNPKYTAVNVSDDGQGIDTTADTQKGMGLRNIQERVADLGGQFHLYSQPGKGTEINIELKND